MRKRSLFGQTLLLLRKEKGLTLVELAERINHNRQQDQNTRKVTKQLLHKIENDPDYRVSEDTIQELTIALDLTKNSHGWELRQIYENAGFSFDKIMSVGRGELKLSLERIEEEKDTIRKMTLKFSRALSLDQTLEAKEFANQALDIFQHSENGAKEKHQEAKLIGNLGTALLAIGQDGTLNTAERKTALKEAINFFKKAIQLQQPGGSPFFNAQLGQTYFTLANSFSSSWQDPNWGYSIQAFETSIAKYDPASEMDLRKLQETCFYLGYAHTMLGQFKEAHSVVNLALFFSQELSALGLYLKSCILAQEKKINPHIQVQDILNYLNKAVILDKEIKVSIAQERLFQELKDDKFFKRLIKGVKK